MRFSKKGLLQRQGYEMSAFWRIFLSGEFIGAALFYVLYGRFDSFLSQAIVFFQAGILLIWTWRYMKNVEGRDPAGSIRFSLLVWGTGWAFEHLALKTGFLGAFYHYNSLHFLSFGPGGVPFLVPTAWLIFGFLGGSITHFLFERFRPRPKAALPPGLEFLAKSLISGWVMLSLGFSVEWHFSQIARFWNWRPEGSSDPVLGGIPLGNFILWFCFGLLIPQFERMTGAAKLRDKSPSPFLQALPTLGFGVLLLAGFCMNLAYGFFLGAIYSSASLIILGSSLVPLLQVLEQSLEVPPTRRWKIPWASADRNLDD
jgi:uncharacterized membrane protein